MINTRRRLPASRSRRLAVALTVGGLLLAACSNSSDDSATTAAPVGTEAADTTPADTTADTTAETTADTAPADTTADTTADTEPADTTPDVGTFEAITGVPGVTDDAINFAVLGTGPSNPLGYCLLECYQGGVQAYFDYQNSLGGVNGRDLVISRVDDDEVGNTQVKSLELIADDTIFGIFGAPLQYAGFTDIGAAGVPLYTTFPAAGDVNGFESSYIPVGTQCVECASPASIWGAKVAGGTKAASIGYGVSQASKDCVDRAESEFATWGADAGVEFVYKNDDLPFGFPNGLGPEVTAMKEAGVDYITTCIDQNGVLTLEQELQRQGMDNVIVALPQGYGDTEYFSSNADLLEGDIISIPYRPMEADPEQAAVKTMLDAFAASGVQINDYAIQGWLGAQLAATGILAAGPQFDRATTVAATNAITDYDAGGMFHPVDWTTAHTAPSEGDTYTQCMSYLKVQGGTLVMASDPALPFDCFDFPFTAWTEPTPTTFG